MRSKHLSALAVVLAIGALILFTGMPDAQAATGALKASAGHHLVDLVLQASPVLLALRKRLEDLTGEATRKLAEIKDGLSADEIRAIEDAHKAIIGQVDETRAAIAQVETQDITAAEAERSRVAELYSIGTRAGLPTAEIDAAVRDGAVTVEAFRTRAFNALADRSAAQGARSSITITRDETETRRVGMQAAIVARMANSTQLDDNAARFRGWSLAELAAEVVGERSMPRTIADREDVLQRAFQTTSDFPIIFSGAINSRLQASYVAAAPTYRRIAQVSNFADFRAHDQIRVGDFPMPVAVGQSGEIKFGTWGEKKETIAVAPYAVQFAITRQMLVNDNLGAIDRMMSGYGVTIALFEDITFFAMKGTTGPTLVETGRAVFNSTNELNLAAAGTAITTAALGAGRAAMRKMKRLDGNPMGIGPSILLVSPDKETEAETVLATIVPGQASAVNLFSGKLTLVTSAQLTGNAWELYADPAVGANWAWGLLDGYTAPRLRMEDRFGTQGVGVSLEHDFGCGAIDYRFGYRNPGA